MTNKKKKETLSKLDKLFLKAQKKLAMSNCSTKKMKEYLKKNGGTKEEISEVTNKLRKYSFLNEEELVKEVISYCDAKHYGYNRIISMLKTREVDENLVLKIKKDDVREEKESIELTKRLIKRYKNKNTLNLKRNIYSALIRYGFDANLASIRAEEVHISHQQELNVLELDYKKLLSSNARKYKSSSSNKKIKDTLLSKGYKLNDIRKVENKIYEMD